MLTKRVRRKNAIKLQQKLARKFRIGGIRFAKKKENLEASCELSKQEMIGSFNT